MGDAMSDYYRESPKKVRLQRENATLKAENERLRRLAGKRANFSDEEFEEAWRKYLDLKKAIRRSKNFYEKGDLMKEAMQLAEKYGIDEGQRLTERLEALLDKKTFWYLVMEALQYCWDDWCNDTGCYPDFLDVQTTDKNHRVEASFSGNFSLHVADQINYKIRNALGLEEEKRQSTERPSLISREEVREIVRSAQAGQKEVKETLRKVFGPVATILLD